MRSNVVDLISVVDGPAFQTNMLAPNTAVEAPRQVNSVRVFN